MDEFNSRMEAQRSILELINERGNNKEELCGLSKKAIERWFVANQLDPHGEICRILMMVSEKLFFLANKSQEQISDEYQVICAEIQKLKHDLERAIG